MDRKTFPIELNGKTLGLDYDWVALADINERFGATTDLFNPKVLREVVFLGLNRHHSEIDQAFVDKASPPIVTTIAIVDRALRYAYDGIDTDPAAEPAKPLTRRQKHKAAMEPAAAS